MIKIDKEKCEFLVQYLNQRVYCSPLYYGEDILALDIFILGENVKEQSDSFLKLKSLLNISDEDVLAILKLLNYSHTKSDSFEITKITRSIDMLAVDYKWVSKKVNSPDGHSYSATGFVYSHMGVAMYQYLQSKGYALHWRNYTVDQLIEKGWITI